MKKAVLLTLGMLLLSSLVFSLSILLFHNTQGTESRFAELSLYDRLYDLDSSIQRGFKEIFERNSGMTLILLDDTIRISETLPHSSNFEAELIAYSNYLEGLYSIDPLVVIDDSVLTLVKDRLLFYIMPHNILVEHSSFPSGNLEITPQNLNVENYSISLTVTKQSMTFDDSLMTTSGSFPLRMSVTTNSGTSVWEKDNIDQTSTNTMTLNFDTGLPTEATITITLDNPAKLIINRGSVTADHNIEIALQHQIDEMTYISYPDNLFTISIPGDDLQKISTARLA
ncbi:MAG: hypothetical protein ISS23_02230 [Nanoarchaeota archaeon]|nr:hypothetical protein [Nanoarchaeota archaeon]